ncbi:MAG: PilZ domain-containing protein [Thermodesulfobacteriota bacterium]|jgi:hypothetical protein
MKYKRILKQYMARLKIRSDEAQEMESYDWDMVPVKNLSAGGMLFDYNKKLELESLLDFKIDISKHTPTINCVGKVTRAEQFQSTSMFCTAIKFTEIGEQEKEIINTTVEELLEYKITHFLIKQ